MKEQYLSIANDTTPPTIDQNQQNTVESMNETCAKGVGDLKPNQTLFVAKPNEVSLETDWIASEECVWDMTITETGPAKPEFVAVWKPSWDWPGMSCSLQSVGNVDFVSCNSKQSVAQGEGFKRVSLSVDVPSVGTGEIKVEDTSSGVDNEGKYTAQEPVAEIFIPIARQSTDVSAQQQGGTIFQWESREEYVIVPLTVISETEGVLEPVTTTQVLTPSVPVNITDMPMMDISGQ